MDIILTNSKNTQNRIYEFTGYKSEILYPPVDTEKFKWLSQWDYFLSFARLADAKRVDRIIEAFKGLNDEKLIVIYGQNDPQKDKIFSLAQWCKNIKLITLDDNDLLYNYVGNARATVYIPIDEDFGMSPVESMSAGKPVIWVNDGWLKETVIHKKTWYLIDKDADIFQLQEAIKYLSPEQCMSMKNDCQKRAKNFDLITFEKVLTSYT